MNSKEWFKFISQNNEQSKKVLGFILLWMDLDDSVSQWVETQNDTIKGLFKLPQIQSFFANRLLTQYQKVQNDFINKFSQVSGGKREGSARIAMCTERGDIYYRNQPQDSNINNYAKVLYSIRNNFFHGSKENSSNNIELICWAFDTLSELLNSQDSSYLSKHDIF